ncbi:superinfection exclusion B family protein [Brevibacillus sp. NPDC058079]|uniref:superinfection exclusion B family protein n=1 Tax=Brevibacillus sp. NPDC058079 TaxID=3346330 RepID=UPI0036E6D32E
MLFLFVVHFSGVVLFIPDFMNETLGISGFVIQQKQWIGITFIISGCIAISQMITHIVKFISKKLKLRKLQRNREKYLESLSQEEKEILKFYFLNNIRTQQISYSSGITRGLEYYQIIYRSSTIGGGMGILFPYNIQLWAWTYLLKNKHLIDL